MRHGRKPRYQTSIPKPDGDDWHSVGDACIWLPSKDASKSIPEQLIKQLCIDDGTGCQRARSILNFIGNLFLPKKAKFELESVRRQGSGLFNEGFSAWMEFIPGPLEFANRYVVLIPKYSTDKEHVDNKITELRILEILSQQTRPFIVAKPVCAVWQQGAWALVQTFVEGIPLIDQSRGQQWMGNQPWEKVGKIAADIHHTTMDTCPADMECFETKRAYALNKMAFLKESDDPLICELRNWCTDNLPTEDPSVLIHGDLLGQNILDPLLSENIDRFGVIDWGQAAWGDPAYDLAIITRGNRKTFTMTSGLSLLLQAYQEAGGQSVSRNDVNFYELLLNARWYLLMRSEKRSGEAEQYGSRVKRILKVARNRSKNQQ